MQPSKEGVLLTYITYARASSGRASMHHAGCTAWPPARSAPAEAGRSASQRAGQGRFGAAQSSPCGRQDRPGRLACSSYRSEAGAAGRGRRTADGHQAQRAPAGGHQIQAALVRAQLLVAVQPQVAERGHDRPAVGHSALRSAKRSASAWAGLADCQGGAGALDGGAQLPSCQAGPVLGAAPQPQPPDQPSPLLPLQLPPRPPGPRPPGPGRAPAADCWTSRSRARASG